MILYLDDSTSVGAKIHNSLEKSKKRFRNRILDNVDIYPFVENLENYIAKASIIISRAGSSTIFESLSANTIPLLLPSKNVSNNHW